MRFTATGELGFNSLDSNMPYVREGNTKSGNPYKSLNVIAIANKNNRMYTEMFGMKRDTIKTKDTDGNDVEVDWSDRNDKDVKKDIAQYRKYVLVYDGEREEYISEMDFIDRIIAIRESTKGKKFTITGNVTKDFYNGNVRNRYQIQNIYEADEEKKNQIRISGMFFFDKDSIDTTDWDAEKKLYINGWTMEYISKEEGQKYVEQQIVFDCSKIDFENESHAKIVDYKLKQIKLSLNGSKIKNNLKSGKVYKIPVELSYQNGAEEVEFDASQLTKNQKEAIELGIKKLEDFAPKGSIYGSRVTIFKLLNYDLRGDYEDGAIEECSTSEFEDMIYVAPKDEDADDVFKKAMNKPVEEESNDDDDDLFS